MVLPAIPFLVLAAFLVAAGLAVTSRGQSEAWASFLSKGLGWIPVVGDAASRVAVALSKYIAHELGKWAVQAEQRVVSWLAGLAHYMATAGYWSLLWPKELWQVVRWIKHVVVPRLVRVTPAPVVKVVNGTVRLSRALEARLQRLEHSIATRARSVVIQVVPRPVRLAVREIEWLRAHWKGITAAVASAGAVALPWGAAGRLEREAKALRRRVGKLERTTVGLGAVALVWAALRRIGWKCLPRSRTGRAVCRIEGMSESVLSELLAGTFLIFGSLSLADFVREVEEATPPLVSALDRLIREL